MHLIFGGYAQGRLSYALKTYHKNRADVFDCAAQPLSEWNGQTILYHLEATCFAGTATEQSPVDLAARNRSELAGLHFDYARGRLRISADFRRRPTVERGSRTDERPACRTSGNGRTDFLRTFHAAADRSTAMIGVGVVSSILLGVLLDFCLATRIGCRIRWSGWERAFPQQKNSCGNGFRKHPAA